MKSTMTAALAAIFTAFLAGRAAALEVSSTAAPGNPLIGTLSGEAERSLLLEPVEMRQRRGGTVVATTRLFRIQGLLYGFVLGVPAGTPPGDYVVRSVGQEAAVTVVPREFRRQDIPLDAGLSDLLQRRDPLKDAESSQLDRLLARFDALGEWKIVPFIMPVEQFRRTSPFGEVRQYDLADGSSMIGVHGGTDLALPEGAAVVAAAAGRVVLARARIVTGNTVMIEHLPGVFSLYDHLSSLAVSEGDDVAAGTPIGKVGSTGFATGPHLHWEVRASGVAVDPEAFVEQSPVDRGPLAAIMAAEGR